MTLDDQSWGYRRNINNADVLSINDLIATFAATVSCGGNFLLNIGPTGDGTIPAVFQERLSQLGQWMNVNSEAIYKSVPWSSQNDTINPNVWYTTKPSSQGAIVYAIVLKWDANATVVLGAPKVSSGTKITILGLPVALKYRVIDQGIEIALPALQVLPASSAWGYVLKLTQLRNRAHAKKTMRLPARYRKHSRIRMY